MKSTVMHYIIVGLGNPGEEYEKSRHNSGRIVAEKFAEKNGFDDFAFDKKAKALVSVGKIGKEKVVVILPETFMNKSGDSVKYFVKNKKDAEGLIVIHDDLDIGLGEFKISFNKGGGGHKGVESVAKAVKTKGFVRIRVGISKTTAKGVAKRPTSDKFMDYVIKNFTSKELEFLQKTNKKINLAVEEIIANGVQKAMSVWNCK